MLTKGLDAFVATLLDQVPSAHYTVIYTTTPRQSLESDDTESSIYETDANSGRDPIHMDLKRDVSSAHARDGDGTSGLPLFEVYQFLNPGSYLSKRHDMINNILTFTPRHLHGYFSCVVFPVDPLCRTFGNRESRGFLRCIREGDGS